MVRRLTLTLARVALSGTFVLLALLSACVVADLDDEGREAECDQICSRTGQCPGLDGSSTCVNSCLASHFPRGCGDAVEAASCTELTGGPQGGGSWLDACYPKCSPDRVLCNGDRLVACSFGRLIQQDCSWVCEARGETYAKVCAASHQGQTSPSGLPECWCE